MKNARQIRGAALIRPMLAVLLLLLAGGVPAAFAADYPDVQVNGLFGGQAVLTVNGKQRLLKPGQRSPEE